MHETSGIALTFALRVDQNQYLRLGGSTVRAMIQITAVPAERPAAGESPAAAEVIIIDKSNSMRGVKLTEARRAAAAAVNVLRDGAEFAIVAGQDTAELVYPTTGRMAQASAATRATTYSTTAPQFAVASQWRRSVSVIFVSSAISPARYRAS